MMSTTGPRMNRARSREVVDKLKLVVIVSDGAGIRIRRSVKLRTLPPRDVVIEDWRVYTGGGIAGDSDQVWLRPVGSAMVLARGPFWNKTQLERALRAWRRGE